MEVGLSFMAIFNAILRPHTIWSYHSTVIGLYGLVYICELSWVFVDVPTKSRASFTFLYPISLRWLGSTPCSIHPILIFVNVIFHEMLKIQISGPKRLLNIWLINFLYRYVVRGLLFCIQLSRLLFWCQNMWYNPTSHHTFCLEEPLCQGGTQ